MRDSDPFSKHELFSNALQISLETIAIASGQVIFQYVDSAIIYVDSAFNFKLVVVIVFANNSRLSFFADFILGSGKIRGYRD